MKLSSLTSSLGSTVRHVHQSAADPDVVEVVLDDGRTALSSSQIVVAVAAAGVADLVVRAADAGCAAVLVPEGTSDGVPTDLGIDVLESVSTSATQAFVLLRGLLVTSHDELADGLAGPSSVHGVADAIGVMVRGTVVLYDRAHRVIAYSVQGHGIDAVRRDAILGRRTPDQWINRFTIDRTAYETYADPGRVVRVATYEGLRPRLRIAVQAGNDILGEISVAEGDNGFADDAEEQLARAAKMAVPAMLWHRRASDLDALARERSMRALLFDGTASASDQVTRALFTAEDRDVAVISIAGERSVVEDAPQDVGSERIAHFLRLHVRALDPASEVVYLNRRFYALVPVTRMEQVDQMLTTVLRQLDAMGMRARAAVSSTVDSVDALPAARLTVEDLLSLTDLDGPTDRVVHAEGLWAELTVLHAVQGVRSSAATCEPLDALRQFDEAHGADLVPTLRAFLDHNGSVSAAATSLFLHSNTMRHRLNRIAEVSGLNLDDPVVRLGVDLHMRAAGGQASAP